MIDMADLTIIYTGGSAVEMVDALFKDAETALLPCLMTGLLSPGQAQQLRVLLTDKTRLGTPWSTVRYMSSHVYALRRAAGLQAFHYTHRYDHQRILLMREALE